VADVNMKCRNKKLFQIKSNFFVNKSPLALAAWGLST
jgi:hypothetical protein